VDRCFHLLPFKFFKASDRCHLTGARARSGPAPGSQTVPCHGTRYAPAQGLIRA
jgi:hypothetical protein